MRDRSSLIPGTCRCGSTGRRIDAPTTQKGHPGGVALFRIRSLAMTYSHMGRPHTTIGDASFHF